MDTYATVFIMTQRMDTYESDEAPSEELLTSAQVQQLASISKSTLSRAVKRERLKPLRTPGGHFRFKRSEVEALMSGGEASA